MLEEIHYGILHDNISFSWYFRLMHINHAINVMYDVASKHVLAIVGCLRLWLAIAQNRCKHLSNHGHILTI